MLNRGKHAGETMCTSYNAQCVWPVLWRGCRLEAEPPAGKGLLPFPVTWTPSMPLAMPRTPLALRLDGFSVACGTGCLKATCRGNTRRYFLVMAQAASLAKAFPPDLACLYLHRVPLTRDPPLCALEK